MKKYKLKLIVQSKTSVEDSPTTHQFISGVYSDSSEVLPDVIDFLKTVSDNNVAELDTGAVSLDLNVGELELPVFERLYNTSDVPEVIQPELSPVSPLAEADHDDDDAVQDVQDVPMSEEDSEDVVSDSILDNVPVDEMPVVESQEEILPEVGSDILPDMESDDALQEDVDEDKLYDDDSDSVYDFS